MTVCCEIIILHKQDATDSKGDISINDVVRAMTDNYDVQILNVTEANPVKTDITRELLSGCNRNESNFILIIGDIGAVERHLAIEAIRNVSDNKEFSEEVAISLLNLEAKLNEIMTHKTTCGIRNQTLIIDLSGPYENSKICLETVADLILYIVYLIRIFDANDKENIPPHNVASASNNNSAKLHNVASTFENYSVKQEEIKTAVKRRKKSSSQLDLLFSNTNESKRHKESFPMISVSDAMLLMREVIKDSIDAMTPETVQLSEAYGRVLFETVESDYNVPPFRASTKHGYAVLVTDGKDLRKVLNVENTLSLTSLEPGTCVWVRTGGPIPDGATAVVQVKDTKPVEKSGDNDNMYIDIMVQPEDGQNIKPVGYDIMKGKTVAIPHKRIGPLEIGLLAVSGRKEVLVAKHLSIGVLSIGDNLEEPGEPLKSGYVYDINGLTLISLLKDKGFHPLDFGIVGNKLVPMRDKIGEALKKVDILVTTGSTNDRDLLKTLLEKYYKANIHFGNVNIKPGKSTIFASCRIDDTKKYFLCLPGNPTSAFIAAQLFLLPFVNEISCDFHSSLYTVIPARMEHQYTPHSRSRFAWTILEWDKTRECASAYSKGNTISDKLVSSIGANALLMLPERETEKVLPKSIIKALLISLPKKYNNKNFCDVKQAPLQTVKKDLSDCQKTSPPTKRYESLLRLSIQNKSSPTRSCDKNFA